MGNISLVRENEFKGKAANSASKLHTVHKYAEDEKEDWFYSWIMILKSTKKSTKGYLQRL